MTHAGAAFWDQFFRQRRESGDDLDWAGVWTAPFLVPLREAGVRTILEMGCGTGHDAARLADEGFDVVMSNVAMHMFPDAVTRTLFAEVGRVVRPGGLFAFHVNALEDRPLRARALPARELEPDYVAEESGQTMHF